ncbi:hypothetical protein C8A03DRAFT_36049 [Achaetomium macrosporum]|uniref:Uncharacterized protein n=1 Tax=Achaetomium macrosporum TaxID=79813 RepID=A0AAN7C6S7_9PEZI|nr:hypothetical protein C8A03DRAFT_36049 [Achaetomium macrosporum]
MSQEVLAKVEEKAENACKELKQVRQRFREKLARITVMRDGLFNASAVMESRASTQLGENVKLLTFAIWSINESYSRVDLAIITASVAVATYLITLNLNNLVRALRKLYAPKRRKLIQQMERDSEWKSLGDRFKVFQRFERGQMKPSEWMIIVFLLSQMMAGLGRTLDRIKKKVGGRLAWLMRPRRRRSSQTSDSTSMSS